jgi:hypothetical protein
MLNAVTNTSLEHGTADEQAFPSWSYNRLVDLFLYRLNLPVYVLPLLVVGIYWLVPLLVSLWDGTALSRGRAEGFVQLLGQLGSPEQLIDAARLFASQQRFQAAESLPYLEDANHFLFTMTLALGAFVGTQILKNFDRTVLSLFRDGIPRAEIQVVSELYRHYRAIAFQMRYVWLSATLGVIAFVLFMHLHVSPDYSYWWGHRQHGAAGLVFAISVGGMVFAGVWGLTIVVFGSWMLARLVTLPVTLRPFHRDCCNGLAPLGRQILLLWGIALFGVAAIYIALRLGYLGIERTPLVWLLAGLGSLAIPAIAIVPLYSVVRTVKSVQSASLERLGRFLNCHLDDADLAIRNGDLPTAQNIISQIDKVKGLFEIYRVTNVWPFNPKAFTVIVVANVIQIVLTAKQVISLAPT